MDEILNNKLRTKAIEEQDILIYFWYNSFEEQLFLDEIDLESKVNYSGFVSDVISNNLDLIPQMSMNNLVHLLSYDTNGIKEIALEEIMKKFNAGEHIFSGENAEADRFGIRTDLWNSFFPRLGEENIKIIKASIDADLETLKQTDSRVYEIVDRFPTYVAIDNFMHFYEQGTFTPEKILSENPNIANSINFGIFDDAIFEMGEDFVSRIAKFPNFSGKLIKLARNNPELFETVKKEFSELEQSEKLQEALDIEFKTLSYATRKAKDLKGDVDFKSLVNCAIRNQEFAWILKVDYTENYEEEFDKECDRSFAKKNILVNSKDILFAKYFGMSHANAQNFFTSYIKNSGQLQLDNDELKTYMAEIERILQIEDPAELEAEYHSLEKLATPLQKIHFEYELREAYTKTFSDALKETDDKLKQSEDVEYIDFEGTQIKQIKLNGKFNLLVHSTDSGFKGDKSVEESLDALNQPKDPASHLASSCFINQDFLGHVPAQGNGVLAVFADVETSDLSLMGLTDINSHIRNYNYQAGRSIYMTAENLPYSSRCVYNEVPIERQEPNYILIFDDSPEEIIKNSYKAAIKYGATVIFMDKKEIEQEQLQNLDTLINDFKETGDLSVLETLISTYETNVAGWLLNRDTSEPDDSFTSGINNERFRDDFEQRESAIYDLIGEYIKNIQGRDDFSEKLQEISRNNAKRNRKIRVSRFRKNSN